MPAEGRPENAGIYLQAIAGVLIAGSAVLGWASFRAAGVISGNVIVPSLPTDAGCFLFGILVTGTAIRFLRHSGRWTMPHDVSGIGLFRLFLGFGFLLFE